MKKGTTLIEVGIVLLIIFSVIGIVCFSWGSKHIWGNKQIIDFNHQTFRVAYILGDDNKWEKHSIRAWKDWENSDSIQVILSDGRTMYTHLRNVKLYSE